jgi:hypothetical protein
VLRLVEFPLDGGGSVLVEVDESPLGGGSVTRGGRGVGELTTSASETFQRAFARIQPAALAAVAQLRDVVDPPDEVELEFGIQLSAEFGAVVAKTAGEANFRVRMRWSGDRAGGRA